MNNEQLDILESTDETSVYLGDRMVATFYGAGADPTGYANALFFSSARYRKATDQMAPEPAPATDQAQPVKVNAPALPAQLTLID